MYFLCFVFFFKQKTAYEMRISDWSSDVCSSDLNTELLLIKGGMRRQCVGGVINGCGPNAVGNGAIAPDLDGPRHPPLIEAAIGIKADIHSVAFAEPCAQRRAGEIGRAHV